MHLPIAYIYEADHHCPDCTESRFGRSVDGFIAEYNIDKEGNSIGVIAPWDEWFQSDDDCEMLTCSDCFVVIDISHSSECFC